MSRLQMDLTVGQPPARELNQKEQKESDDLRALRIEFGLERPPRMCGPVYEPRTLGEAAIVVAEGWKRNPEGIWFCGRKKEAYI